MAIDEEMLMAFADGELAGAEAEAVAKAIAADPALAEKVMQHRALRSRLAGAFEPILAEPLPPALAALPQQASTASGGGIVDLETERQKRRSILPAMQRWTAIAAALIIGLFAGNLVDLNGGVIGEQDGKLVARAKLATALDSQLASQNSTDSPIRIGLTFRDTGGRYCRTFEATGGSPISGLACHENDGWQVKLASATNPATSTTQYRTAGSDTVIEAAQAMMQGSPLDAAAEERARSARWRK